MILQANKVLLLLLKRLLSCFVSFCVTSRKLKINPFHQQVSQRVINRLCGIVNRFGRKFQFLWTGWTVLESRMLCLAWFMSKENNVQSVIFLKQNIACSVSREIPVRIFAVLREITPLGIIKGLSQEPQFSSLGSYIESGTLYSTMSSLSSKNLIRLSSCKKVLLDVQLAVKIIDTKRIS